ncbi:hypothetical protein [uncultured Thiodictyon sp.]|jgi:tellurite resistance protein|nr:hypothetical protein [uncultured Thiodictyon sp.]
MVMGMAGLTIGYLGFGLLTMLTGIIAFLLVRTALAVWRQGICVPGH